MEQSIIDLTCPNCGGKVRWNQQECDWCHSPVFVGNLSELDGMNTLGINRYLNTYRVVQQEAPAVQGIHRSIALCYLKLHLYDKALAEFEAAMEEAPEEGINYYYAAICLLKGKKAFLSQLPVINRILEYLEASNMLEEKGINYYFMAYIKYDYFERKHLKTDPGSKVLLEKAALNGISEKDKNDLFKSLMVERPAVL